jgi:hypothetical protein
MVYHLESVVFAICMDIFNNLSEAFDCGEVTSYLEITG